MEIYQAKEFRKLLPSGSTNPWQIIGEKGGENFELVVKNFRPDTLHQRPVFKELFCAVLARELGLSVPDFGLIDCSPQFYKLLPVSAYKAGDNDKSLRFCTKLMDGCTTYSDATKARVIHQDDMESIFAFDILIWNLDRIAIKPNILIGKQKYYLIDHELSLTGLTDFVTHTEDIQKFMIFANGRSTHLFCKSLQSFKDVEFATFQEMLQRLDFRNIDTQVNEMVELGVNIEDYTFVRPYLMAAKQNVAKFIPILKAILT